MMWAPPARCAGRALVAARPRRAGTKMMRVAALRASIPGALRPYQVSMITGVLMRFATGV